MRYLIENHSKNKKMSPEMVIPKLSIVDEDELFEILQEKPKGIAVTKLPNLCVIDWS